jgi:hypothetical protein
MLSLLETVEDVAVAQRVAKTYVHLGCARELGH